MNTTKSLIHFIRIKSIGNSITFKIISDELNGCKAPIFVLLDANAINVFYLQ